MVNLVVRKITERGWKGHSGQEMVAVTGTQFI